MKKLVISLFAAALTLTACGRDDYDYSKNAHDPSAVYYNDWDRAVRVDVDMHNMYVSTPRKIEKPIDLYMAMALALKYNYTRRLITYEDSIIRAGMSPVNRLPEIVSNAGYINDTNSKHLSPDLKMAWNMLDMTLVYCLSQNPDYAASVAYEETRKVIHNILQETRTLYWKTLTAQRVLPLIDDMTEFMTLEVDEINAEAKRLEAQGKYIGTEALVKKRDYMDSIKKLATLKRDLETAQPRLASLMGMHPATDFRLVGPEYGNFDLPEVRGNLSELEWLALTNRPELRSHDLSTSADRLHLVVRDFRDPGLQKYKSDPDFYNKMWSKQAKEIGMSVFEDPANPNAIDLANLRRQRMSALVLSQLYVAWAQYQSAVEDYQINMEIATTSENIAEDITIMSGSKAQKSHLESARAIADEVKAFKSYVDLQEALGNLYATIGMDALPYFMIEERPSQIALYLRNSMEKWSSGEFMPDNRPYLLNVPAKRPPVNLSNASLLPDLSVETGTRVNVTVPKEMIARMDFQGKVTSKAGLIDDTPLPKWLHYNAETYTFSGVALPGQQGMYHIKAYFVDEKGSVGYVTYRIKVVQVFVPGSKVPGQLDGSSAQVLRRCVGSQCADDYIDAATIGTNVQTSAR